MHTDLTHIRQQYEDKCRELELEREKVLQVQESLTRRLW